MHDTCRHPPLARETVSEPTLRRAASFFGVLADVGRLRVLEALAAGPACPSEIAEALRLELPVVSQRLRVLRDADLVVAEREGRHVTYTVADGHVLAMIRQALDHAGETGYSSTTLTNRERTMTHTVHTDHPHVHGPGCGHPAVRHGDHVDYVHDGHLHHAHAGHVDDCAVAVDAKNPAACTPQHACGAHDAAHHHGPTCGHAAVPHGDHVDYLVAGHLHHAHGTHCDDHGPLGPES